MSGWSTWGVYLVSGTLQGVLLAMAVYYEIQTRNRKDSINVSHATVNDYLADNC